MDEIWVARGCALLLEKDGGREPQRVQGSARIKMKPEGGNWEEPYKLKRSASRVKIKRGSSSRPLPQQPVEKRIFAHHAFVGVSFKGAGEKGKPEEPNNYRVGNQGKGTKTWIARKSPGGVGKPRNSSSSRTASKGFSLRGGGDKFSAKNKG